MGKFRKVVVFIAIMVVLVLYFSYRWMPKSAPKEFVKGFESAEYVDSNAVSGGTITATPNTVTGSSATKED